MIHRPARRSRRPLLLEPLEARTLLASGVVVGPTPWNLPAPNPAASELFVRFQPTASASLEASAIRAVGATTRTTYPDGVILLQVGGGSGVASAVRQLEANPFVVYAQADLMIHSEAAQVIPNEQSFPYTWGLNDTDNVDIDAPEAWSVTTGTPSTIVAVLDTGLDLSNPDFAGRIWTNPVNDAAQGYPNDVHGWNFVANNNNISDNNGHGTHVTSILAATGNNGTGIAGVDWQTQIMPVKFLDSNGNGTTDAAVSAIIYAVNHGARVINASWGGLDFTQPLYDAISYANAHNVVFVTAAGNDGTDNDVVPSVPATFRLPNELSIAAVDANGQLASFSNYGPQTVDIAAPGVDILGDYPTNFSSNGLQLLSGTSMSTAFVSGVAALVAGQFPNLTAAQIVQRIDASAKPLPGLAGQIITGGIVDAYQALTLTVTPSAGSVSGAPALSPNSETDPVVQATILSSDEFLTNNGGTAQGFVTGLYLDLLDRSPDPGGLAYWTNLYQSGTSTRFEIASALINSPEAQATQVASWYQNDLGRTGSISSLKTDPGVLSWVQLLNAGLSDEVVEGAILASPEYRTNHGGSSLGVAAGWYQNLTGRGADPAGQSVWANDLSSGPGAVHGGPIVPELVGSKSHQGCSLVLQLPREDGEPGGSEV